MPSEIKYIIELNELEMKFKQNIALNKISLKIQKNIITGLVGPDASGKSTLLRILAGLLDPSSGQVNIFGKDFTEINIDHNNSIGYMPQRFGLYEELSVLDNLNLYADLRNVMGKIREDLFTSLLDFTSLKDFTSRLAGKLSGGMKQKLGIACVLLGSPRLLLLDEPSVGVDPLSRRELWNMVQELSDHGMSIIWSTTSLDEAERCSDIIMLDGGKVLYTGSPAQMTDRAKGRVFQLKPLKGQGKQSLLHWSKQDGVADALIQGEYLRIISKEKSSSVTVTLAKHGAKTISPKLEDAYMLSLGGINQQDSPFSKKEARQENKAEYSINAIGLSKVFGDFTAADDISFKVQPGKIFGLLGPNGAGKSTIFRMLCGLSRPTRGQCFVDNVNLLTSGSEARSRLGYMAQKFSLYTDIKVKNNIHFFGKLYGLSKNELKIRTEELVNALGLSPWLDSVTGLLPLGQKQRLSLICATLHNPSVLFLDEPTSGVDVITRRDFWKHIIAMTQNGTSVLVTTHFMEEAEYCDTLAFIDGGKIIALGSPDELKAKATTFEANVDSLDMEETFIAYMHRQNN